MIVYGPEVVEWVAKRTSEYGNFGAAVGIGVQKDGKLIGGVVYNDFNGPNVCMHTAAVSGTPWLTRTTLWRFFHYPFIELGCNRVTALVGQGNIKSRKLVFGVGFRIEAHLEGAHPTGDLIVYAMWRDRCRWINQRTVDELKAA
jgi:RimJ/RimL family protein N-acetyltransferase